MSVISLTTDFGMQDGYAGIMKAVVLSINQSAVLVDITHEIAPGDIRAAAWVIHNAYSYFPSGSVHVIVVDPGVGSNRRGIVLQGSGHTFVAPDNGVVSMLLDHHASWNVFEITNSAVQLPVVSTTFHGRDVFAPVAAHLLSGFKAENVGPLIDQTSLVTFRRPGAATIGNQVHGSIVYVDRFGNLITNIPASLAGAATSCLIGETELPVGTTYSSVSPGLPVAYAASHGYIELGINSGNACTAFGAGVGTAVSLNI